MADGASSQVAGAQVAGPVPNWLSETEQRSWRTLIDVTTGVLATLDNELRAQHGLSLGEYEVLVHLSEAPEGSLRMTDLAGALRLSPSGITRRIDGDRHNAVESSFQGRAAIAGRPVLPTGNGRDDAVRGDGYGDRAAFSAGGGVQDRVGEQLGGDQLGLIGCPRAGRQGQGADPGVLVVQD